MHLSGGNHREMGGGVEDTFSCSGGTPGAGHGGEWPVMAESSGGGEEAVGVAVLPVGSR